MNQINITEMLPGILIGERVTLRSGSTAGTIMATGHQYGPGSGHDQAKVVFRVWHDGTPGAGHPLRRRSKWIDSARWYYLETLQLCQSQVKNSNCSTK